MLSVLVFRFFYLAKYIVYFLLYATIKMLTFLMTKKEICSKMNYKNWD